ncbi:MAG: laccase domain-containing protein [Actinobacteria bacterium]|nr:laccase domain-containing protein [Actinomycetota bacterium]
MTVFRWDCGPAYEVAFSTRVGGVSEGPFASLNLGKLTLDREAHVEENRRRLCAQVGAEVARLALNRQQHSAIVNRAQEGSRGEPGDGLWTDEPGVPMLKLTADCVAIAIAREDRAALAVLHAGWRGLLEGIVEAGVAALGGTLRAAVGPAIGPCCYEVGSEAAEPFRQRFGSDVLTNRKLDLWTAAERALGDAGVTTVERFDLCTSCNPELFFSHRRDDGVTGRQGVIGVVIG